MKLWMVALCLFTFMSCTDIDLDQDFELDTSEVELAVPLFSSQMSIPAIADVSKINGNIEILQDGTIQVNYRGDVVEQSSTQIFPPIPGIFDLPIIDTVQSIQLPANAQDQISRAVIGDTNIDFTFGIDASELVEIEVTLPELSLNGEVFRRTFTIDNRNGDQSTIASGLISIEDHTLLPSNNQLTLRYRAIDEQGQSMILPMATIGFDVFTFNYVEGIFAERTFDIKGDIITIDLFSKWISGGVDFKDPKVTLVVDNSFGMPTKSKVNFLDIITLEGETLNLESSLLSNGIEFEYPSIEEAGSVKETTVIFDKTNSNIQALFSEKAGKVSYDIDALINEGRPQDPGFLTDSSFFRIQVEVNLPIDGKVNDLVLQETTDLDLSSYDEVASMELDHIISNGFPMDMVIQVYFDDATGMELDSLYDNGGLAIDAASLGQDGLVNNSSNIEGTTMIDAIKMETIKNAKSIRVVGRFDTQLYNDPVRLLDIYNLDITMGAKIKLQ
ncbi:MAG: hypothetical protein HKN68_17540 [Saprospiraceae bacterium]|nr:hypothetical protein [Saprospiraceae bacterium]